ncbi:MAG: 2-oxoglutarate ferredoxin oxidoreductase subunit beta, partial [Candidatus Aldehydirespiratoraceae bacterium]
FGPERERGVMQGTDGFLHLVDVADVGLDQILIHDEKDDRPSLAFALARLNTDDQSPTPFGVFRNVDRAEYSQSVSDQVMAASEQHGPGDLDTLLASNGTWTVD